MSAMFDIRLYGVLDPAQLGGRDPVAAASAAVDGGITMLQLRDKSNDAKARVALASKIKQALAGSGVPLIINDHVDTAAAIGADGVHLGRTDMKPAAARAELGPNAIIGVTIHHGHEAEQVDPNIADYAGLGPVYLTRSKDPGDPPLGPFGLERLINQVQAHLPGLPCVAIAGISAKNVTPVMQAGADGVAVISAIFGQPDIRAATHQLRQILDQVQTELEVT